MVTPPPGPSSVAAAAAILGAALSAAELALTSLPEPRIQALVETGDASFERFAANRPRILARWLAARLVALSAAAAVVVDQAGQLFGMSHPLLAVLVAAPIYGALVELLATLARRRPEQVGRIALRVFRPFEWAVAPIALPLAWLGSWATRRIPEEAQGDARITETEVSWAVTRGQLSGAIEDEPATMIRNVLEFKHATAHDVMVPRARVVAIDVATPLDEVFELVTHDGHSRFPIFRDSIDNVVGVLYAKDLFGVLRGGKLAHSSLRATMRTPVLFVTEAQPATSVLREMRARRMHLAVVLDEYGGMSGLIALEDIIEEIVGDIRDEYDTEDPTPLQKLGEGHFVADAAIALTDLEAQIGCALPSEASYESLGGLVVHRAGRVPSVGETLELSDLRLIVREADDKRVVKVEIVRLKPAAALDDRAAS